MPISIIVMGSAFGVGSLTWKMEICKCELDLLSQGMCIPEHALTLVHLYYYYYYYLFSLHSLNK